MATGNDSRAKVLVLDADRKHAAELSHRLKFLDYDPIIADSTEVLAGRHDVTAVIVDSSGDDAIVGGFGSDTLRGGLGDDRLIGGLELDTTGLGAGGSLVIADSSSDALFEDTAPAATASFSTAPEPSVETLQMWSGSSASS